MTKKCVGCGAVFQTSEVNKPGFVEKENFEKSLVCQRCFKIKHYGDYQIIKKDKKDYKKIFDEIKSKNELILFLCDILTLDESLKELNNFKGRVILVITKKDLLPKSVKENKLLNYVKNNYNLDVVSILFVSSVKNYNLDVLVGLIYKYKKSNKVYLVGNTNAGKSTLINAIIKSYSEKDSLITTSILPATTLDVIEIKLNDKITLIDTPGIVSEDNFLSDEEAKNVKIITPKVEIKPITFQMKPNQSIIIGNFARIDYLSDHNNSFTLYVANKVAVKRINLNTNNSLRNLTKHTFSIKERSDVVINGLCFCKIVSEANINIYVKDNVKVFIIPNLI